MDTLPLGATPEAILPDKPGVVSFGWVLYNSEDSANTGAWCIQLFFGWPYALPVQHSLKRTVTGSSNPPPAQLPNADISFECTGFFISPTYSDLFAKMKWYIEKKKAAPNRGAILITSTTGKFSPIKVQVTYPYPEFTNSIDICTPNSEHVSCNPLAGSTQQADPTLSAGLERLQREYQEMFEREFGFSPPAASP